MMMLYGVLPPAMAWSIFNKESKNLGLLSRTGPALLGNGMLACGIMMEQIIPNLAAFVPFQ